MAILKQKSALVTNDFVNGALFDVDMNLVDGNGAPDPHWVYNAADEQLDLYIDPFASHPAGRAIRQDYVYDPVSGSVRWEDARADYRVVPDMVERARLTDPAELADGTLCYVVSTNTTYMYRNGAWTEYMVPPPRTDILQKLEFDPEEPAGEKLIWRDARTDMEVVQDTVDLNNRLTLPLSHLSVGKLVYVRSTGTIYELAVDPTAMNNTSTDWKPLVGGVTYVGRTSNLPTPATDTLIDGQLFIIRMDFMGEDLYRLVAWDSSIPASNLRYVDINQLAFNITPPYPSGFPIIPPNTVKIDFVLPPGSVIGQDGLVALRVNFDDGAGATQHPSFQLQVTPGTTANHIATMLEAEFLNVLPGEEITAVESGDSIILTPKAATPPLQPIADVGPFAADADIPITPADGDWGELTGSFALTQGNLAGTVVQQGGTLFFVNPNFGWVYQPPVVTGGTTLQVHIGTNPNFHGAHLTFSGQGNMLYFQPGGSGIGIGEYAIVTAGSFTFPAADPQYPLMGNLAGQTVRNGDFIAQIAPGTYQILASGDPDNVGIRNAYLNGQSTYALGGTVSNAPSPPAPFQPPGTTNLHVQITSIIGTKIAQGPMTQPMAGGWRFLNRMIWNKDTKIDSDQVTDQKEGDLQITREDQHEEIKSWNAASKQWDLIYSRDEINSAIAALSLFEGTVQEIGGVAPGAIAVSALPDLVAMTAAGDTSKISHYWTWVGKPNFAVTAQTPNLGQHLQSAILSPGDWLQVARQGQVGNADLGTPGGGQLVWSWIGGDLLAKARADRLFGLQPWSAAGWEQGSLVLFDGDVYRATTGVTSQDPPPKQQLAPIDTNLSGVSSNELNGTPLAELPSSVNDGDIVVATAAGTINPLGVPFEGHAYADQDTFLYSADPAFAGKGTTPDGFLYDTGWIYLGQLSPIPNPMTINPPQPPTPWQVLNIGGGLKVANTDSDLPNIAPPGQTWIVLQSAQAGGKQALFAYDHAAQQWQQLGGGGTPLSLSGGTIFYPKTIYVDDDLNGTITKNIADGKLTVQPSVVGDILSSRNQAGYPLVKAISADGQNWKDYHPQRATFDTDGASKPQYCDYPTQMNVAYNAGKARITHIGARDHSWYPVEQPKSVGKYIWSTKASEITLSGQQTQEGNTHVGIPRDIDGGIVDPGWSEAVVDVWFPTRIDSGSANDQYCQIEVYVSDSSNWNQGTIRDHQWRDFSIPDHWAHFFSWNVVIPQVHVMTNFFIHARAFVKVAQSQSGSWIQAKLRLAGKVMRNPK